MELLEEGQIITCYHLLSTKQIIYLLCQLRKFKRLPENEVYFATFISNKFEIFVPAGH